MQLKLKEIGSVLTSRNSAITFFGKIDFKQTDAVILDFEGVDSITPSFAHEMLSIIVRNKKNRNISFKNGNDDIDFQLKKALISL